MKIGYLRQNQPVELDFWNASASNLGTELRNGFIEAFLKLGHEVTIYSPINKKHLCILEGEGEGFDYEIFKKLKYDLDGLPSDLDLLFIEAASTATIYSYGGKGNEKPYIERTMEVIGAHTGRTVVYQHGNHILGFPFGEIDKPTEGLAFNNLKVLVKKANVFTNGKTWEIWHHATNDNDFLITMDKIQRFSYKKMVDERGVKTVYIPMCYSPNFDAMSEPPLHPEYDLLYIGSSRDANRQKKLFGFYSDLDKYGLKVKVIGDWRDVEGYDVPWTKDTFVPQTYKGIEFTGRMGGHGEVYRFYESALATIQIADMQFEKIGMITTRVTQAIRAGVVMFADKDIPGMGSYVGTDMTISLQNRDEYVDKILQVKKMNYEERVQLNKKQRSNLERWIDVLPRVLKA